MMTRVLASLGIALSLAGCATLNQIGAGSAPQQSPELAPTAKPVSVQPLGNRGYSAASLDKTSAEEKKAALAVTASGSEKLLGKSVVALGPPAEAGLWIQSPHVKSVGQGRITAPNGKSLGVELRPATGGALLSFSAYQALGLDLTSLPEITLYAK